MKFSLTEGFTGISFVIEDAGTVSGIVFLLQMTDLRGTLSTVICILELKPMSSEVDRMLIIHE